MSAPDLFVVGLHLLLIGVAPLVALAIIARCFR